VSIQKTRVLDFISSGMPSTLCLLVHIDLHGTAIAFDGDQQMNEPTSQGQRHPVLEGKCFHLLRRTELVQPFDVLDCGYQRSGAPIMEQSQNLRYP
jgi:hypothetical protein